MKHSWNYCALYYLNMWLRHDRRHHESINCGDRERKLATIKDAATDYRIARNLPKKYEINSTRYEPILAILDTVSPSDFTIDTVEAISNVQEKISQAYGNRGVLSATTKLLWLQIRRPIIIYDSQVRKALKTKNGNLKEFYDAWRTQYENQRKTISTACVNLSAISTYACDQRIGTPSYIRDIAAQPWFQERVFDVHLWHKGQ